MPRLVFGAPSNAGSAHRHRRPPLDFFSAKVRGRLFVLVGALWLVVILATKAGDERLWKWMWGEPPGVAGGPPLQKSELAAESIDTRLVVDDAREPGGIRVQSPAAGESAALPSPAPQIAAAWDTPASSWNTASRQAVAQVLAGISIPERDRLQLALNAVLLNRALATEVQLELAPLVAKLGESWQAYVAGLREALARNREGLSEPELGEWRAIVERLDRWWADSLQPALQAVAEQRVPAPEQRVGLAKFQVLVDERSLAEIKDDHVFRAEDSPAWYRLLDNLHHLPLEEIERNSTGRVGFVHLFGQAQEFRGKLVTVRGFARHITYERAPKNPFGIAGYHLCWLQPAGGPDSPIAVYLLELPPEFDLKKFDGQTQKHEFEVTGYSFKRLAYPAGDGPRLAPTVLAKMPRWTPPPPVPVDRVSVNQYLLIVAGCAAFTLLVAAALWYAYRKADRAEREEDQKSLPSAVNLS